jgi:hypothetical protein
MCIFFTGHHSNHHRQTPKTAGNKREPSNWPEVQIFEGRSRTAPEKGRRKNWAAGSIDIQTSRGEKIKIKASGNTM